MVDVIMELTSIVFRTAWLAGVVVINLSASEMVGVWVGLPYSWAQEWCEAQKCGWWARPHDHCLRVTANPTCDSETETWGCIETRQRLQVYNEKKVSSIWSLHEHETDFVVKLEVQVKILSKWVRTVGQCRKVLMHVVSYTWQLRWAGSFKSVLRCLSHRQAHTTVK